MVEDVLSKMLVDALIGLRGDVQGMRQELAAELRSLRAELREQTGVLARRADAAEARLTALDRRVEPNEDAVGRLDRKLDFIVAAVAPLLPDPIRTALRERNGHPS